MTGNRRHEITVVATSGPRFRDFAPYVPAVDGAGRVSFQAQLADGGSGIFSSAGGEPESWIDTAHAPLADFFSHPAHNDAGALCFYARLTNGEEGVFLHRGPRTDAIAAAPKELRAIGPLGPTINATGSVAFRATTRTGNSGILVGNALGFSRVAETGGAFRACHGLPVINDQGTVVFRADLAAGGAAICDGGVRRPPTVIVDTNGEFAALGLFPSLNRHDTVAFAATLKAGGAGIFTHHAGTLTQVVERGTRFESLRGALINDAGTVIYFATPRGGSIGVYGGPDPVADRIFGVGDTRLGSAVTEFALNPVSFGPRGHIAVRATLQDGRQRILRVEPFDPVLRQRGAAADRLAPGSDR